MFNLDQFIADHVVNRQRSLFADDIEANKETLRAEIEGRSVCVVGGAGSIGSSFIKAMLPFKPSKLVVVSLWVRRQKEDCERQTPITAESLADELIHKH